MIILMAHHVELMHLPVLAIMFAAGFWIGWHMISRFVGSEKPGERGA